MAKSQISDELSTFKDTYRVLKQIAVGGAGTVFEVQASDGRTLALKRLDPSRSTSSGLKRFKNEVEFCQQPHHPNIVRVLDAGVSQADASLFYVMALFKATLRTILREGLPREGVLPLFHKILDGVEAAHLKRVFHRDLKPENILCQPGDGALVVADFGIAHFSEEHLHTLVETQPEDRLANFRYAAPEQKSRSATVDQRADIFALGSILNELFTGSPVLGPGYPPISQSAPEYEYLDAVVDSMVRQNPEERPNSIDEVKKALIARGDEAATRQRIESLKNTVVPASQVDDPLIAEPARVVDADLCNGKLVIILSQPVTAKWVTAFRSMSGFQYSANYHPSMFSFSGATASIDSDGHWAQQLLDVFKTYVETTNREYRAKEEAEARRREDEERKRLQAEFRAEEERQGFRKTLRI